MKFNEHGHILISPREILQSREVDSLPRMGRRSVTHGGVCKWKRLRMQAAPRVPLRSTRCYIPTAPPGRSDGIHLGFMTRLHQAEGLPPREIQQRAFETND